MGRSALAGGALDDVRDTLPQTAPSCGVHVARRSGGEVVDSGMQPVIIDGRARARAIVDSVASRAAMFETKRGRRPSLAIIRVGDDDAQDRYAAKKVSAGADAGVEVAILRPAAPTMASVREMLRVTAADDRLDAIFIQYPLPEQLDERVLFDAIAIDKDVDCASCLALGELMAGGDLVPANVAGLLDLLAANAFSLSARRVLVASPFVSITGPLATLLMRSSAFVSVEPDAERAKTQAGALNPGDVLVSCFGQPGLIDGQTIPDGVAVVDGAYFHPRGGDIRVTDAGERFALWVPSRNALGPMTIACLLQNTLQLAEARAQSH